MNNPGAKDKTNERMKKKKTPIEEEKYYGMTAACLVMDSL